MYETYARRRMHDNAASLFPAVTTKAAATPVVAQVSEGRKTAVFLPSRLFRRILEDQLKTQLPF